MTGGYYAFYVTARDFNGESDPSQETIGVVCEPPGHLTSPQYVSATKASVSLRWSAPQDTGGCPILSYALFVDDGNGGAYSEVDSEQIRNKPYITSYTVTGLSGVGTTFQFKLKTFNEVDEKESLPTEVLLAAVPDKPSAVPY